MILGDTTDRDQFHRQITGLDEPHKSKDIGMIFGSRKEMFDVLNEEADPEH